jgi:hypothetical protein
MKWRFQHTRIKDPEDAIVTIIHGEKSINVLKDQLKGYLFYTAKEKSDTTLMGTAKKAYYNAFEWIIANMFRIIGIQLYEDGEIRLNIIPSQIVDGKRCILLKRDIIKDRSLDNALYMSLFDLIYGKPDVDVIN